MATDTKLESLIMNTLTEAQYTALTSKDPNQIYLTPAGQSLPDQTGHSGVLSTNGTTASWNDNIKVSSTSILLTNVTQPLVNGQIVIGNGAGGPGNSGVDDVILGNRATAGNYGIAIGADAKAQAESSIQLGAGTNTQSGTFAVSTGNYPNQKNVTLLNNQGFVPADALAADGASGQVLSKTDTGMAWINIPSVTSASDGDDGLRGDYCCRYGVIKWPNGAPTIGSGNTVSVPAGLVLNVPGTVANPSASLITLASAQTVTLTKTTNSLLVYVQGLDELVQCDKICFSKSTPVDDDSTCQLWWNGEEMQFRSNDQGNVWIAVRAGILGELIYTEGSLTRIERIGWYHYLPETTAA